MSPDGRQRLAHFVFLDYLRILAASLVVWDHLFVSWPRKAGTEFFAAAWLHIYVTGPLGIIQDFGWMGVALFFLVSGFVITHVAMRETVGEFIVRRVFRIYPMVALFVFLSLVSGSGTALGTSAVDILANITLANYFLSPLAVLVPGAWTLPVEMLFYAMTAATMAFHSVRAAIACNLVFTLGCILLAGHLNEGFARFAANVAFVPYLVVGQIFYAGIYRASISPLATVSALGACLATVMAGIVFIHSNHLPLGDSYMVSFLYACFFFCLAMHFEERLRAGGAVRLLANASFSLYLCQGVIGRSVFQAAYPVWGAASASFLALFSTLAAAGVIHIWFEKPVLAAGYRLAASLRATGKAQPPLTAP